MLFCNKNPNKENCCSNDNQYYNCNCQNEYSCCITGTTGATGDVLTVRNHSSSSAVTLQTLAGGTQINSNASILIQKVSE